MYLLPTSLQTLLQSLLVFGYSYRDLNKNGRMDVYEDKTQPLKKGLLIFYNS